MPEDTPQPRPDLQIEELHRLVRELDDLRTQTRGCMLEITSLLAQIRGQAPTT